MVGSVWRCPRCHSTSETEADVGATIRQVSDRVHERQRTLLAAALLGDAAAGTALRDRAEICVEAAAALDESVCWADGYPAQARELCKRYGVSSRWNRG